MARYGSKNRRVKAEADEAANDDLSNDVVQDDKGNCPDKNNKRDVNGENKGNCNNNNNGNNNNNEGNNRGCNSDNDKNGKTDNENGNGCKCRCRRKRRRTRSRHGKAKRRRCNSNRPPKCFDFKRFPRYEEIQKFICDLQAKHPKKVKVVSIGRTHDDRSIDMAIIKADFCKEKDAVLIDAGIHAREWLTNTTVLYFIDYLLKDDSLLKMMDFYVIPCLNPDGYEYSHTCNRLWRKNMNKNESQSPSMWGVDLNRNFPVQFGKKGSSSKPRMITYRGTHALSEPESQALAGVMKKYNKVIKLYISVHSYGNFIFYPWSYTRKCIEDRDILDSCAHQAKIAIYRRGKRWFHVGTAASQMYLVSGSSTDYATCEHNIKFCYCIELQKFGKSGFQPKTKDILPIAIETTEGFKCMVKYVYEYYNKKEKKSLMSFCYG